MKTYESKDLRNVALLGHGGSGKTILAEAMALKTKLIDRMGRIEDHTTISDFDPEEQHRAISITTSLIPLEYKNTKINLKVGSGTKASTVINTIVSKLDKFKIGFQFTLS